MKKGIRVVSFVVLVLALCGSPVMQYIHPMDSITAEAVVTSPQKRNRGIHSRYLNKHFFGKWSGNSRISDRLVSQIKTSRKKTIRLVSRTTTTKKKTVRIAICRDSGGRHAAIGRALAKIHGVTYRYVTDKIKATRYDALILPGGADVNPSRYHASNNASRGINNSLDRMQLSVIDQFVAAGKPILGICRGCQILNVYFGGTLKQNIKRHRRTNPPIWIAEDSWLYRTWKKNSVRVNSNHHQCV